MNKKTLQSVLRASLIIGDIVLIAGSILLAYYLRFYGKIIPVTRGIPYLNYYIYPAPFMILVYLLAFNYAGLYLQERGVSRLDEFFRVFSAVTASIIILMSSTFLVRRFSYSRIVIVYLWVLSVIVLGAWRIAYRAIFRSLKKREIIVQCVLVIGNTEISRILIDRIKRSPESGYKVVGIVDNKLKAGKKIYDTRVLGKIKETPKIIEKENVDEVFIGLTNYNRQEIADMILQNQGVRFMIASDVLSIITKNIEYDELHGIPVFAVKELPLDNMTNRVVKRACDIIFSILGLIILSPLFLIAAVIIKFTSPGPVFFRQERVSRHNKVFLVWKFRTMRVDAEAKTGPVWAKADDPRRTKIGSFLRKTSIDEFPQLINVLLGEMSIVGPRPERPHFVNKFKETIPRYMERHKVKAGMTGWAAVNGLRGDTSLEERVKYDLYYIENWSLWFDIKIIIKTALEVFHHTTAY